MPSRASSSSGSDSGSEAPEAVALSCSKKYALKQNADIHMAQALLRAKMKLKNRQRDQKLKERAASNDTVPCQSMGKEKELLEEEEENGDDEGQGASNAEARMLKAMKGAEDKKREDEFMEERDDADDSGGSSPDVIDMDEDDSDADSSEDDEGAEDEDKEMELHESSDYDQEMDSGVESEQITKSLKKPSDYLPDELFKAAFSQATKTQSSQSSSNQSTRLQKERKKRKPTSSTPKDVIVGSKAIRTLSSAVIPGLSQAAVPSTKVNKFLSRTLDLKGQRLALGKGWERRSGKSTSKLASSLSDHSYTANIGVLRRNGPAARFVRSR